MMIDPYDEELIEAESGFGDLSALPPPPYSPPVPYSRYDRGLYSSFTPYGDGLPITPYPHYKPYPSLIEPYPFGAYSSPYPGRGYGRGLLGYGGGYMPGYTDEIYTGSTFIPFNRNGMPASSTPYILRSLGVNPYAMQMDPYAFRNNGLGRLRGMNGYGYGYGYGGRLGYNGLNGYGGFGLNPASVNYNLGLMNSNVQRFKEQKAVVRDILGAHDRQQSYMNDNTYLHTKTWRAGFGLC